MKFLLWIVAGFTLFGVAALGYDFIRSQREEGEIRSKIALLKSKGWPTCGDDMPKGPPESENAFLVIAPHITKNRETYEPQKPILRGLAVDSLLDPADEKFLKEALRLEKPVLEIVHRAFRGRKQFFIPHKWDHGLALLLPEYAALKSLQKLLLGEVVLSIRAKDFVAARERLTWVHRVQKALCSDSVLIGRLVAAGMMTSERNILVRMQAEGFPVLPLMEESLREWRTFPSDLRPVIGAEMVGNLATCRYLDSARFWRYQTPPMSLIQPRPNDLEKGLTFKRGDYLPSTSGARRKLSETLDAYEKLSELTTVGTKSEHINKLQELTNQLWSSVPLFSGFYSSVAGPGPGTTAGGSLELLRLQPAIMELNIRVLDAQASGETVTSSILSDELTQPSLLNFEIQQRADVIELLCTEGTVEFSRMKLFGANMPSKAKVESRKYTISQIQLAQTQP